MKHDKNEACIYPIVKFFSETYTLSVATLFSIFEIYGNKVLQYQNIDMGTKQT